MNKTLLLIGLGATGLYFFDSKKGKKRRALFSQSMTHAMHRAEYYCNDFADRSKPVIEQIRRQGKPLLSKLGTEGQRFADRVGHAARDYAHNGHSRRKPSARLTGAAAGALALYGVGRSGFSGALFRTLSLGLLTKALLATR